MFQLCAVLETLFNLSYESLTSREAWQALTGLCSLDPTFYQEIMHGNLEVPTGEEEEEPEAECDHTEVNSSTTIPELIGKVLDTTNLNSLSSSVASRDGDLDRYKSEEDEYSKPMYLSTHLAEGSSTL